MGLFSRWRDGQVLDSHLDPLVSLLDQHHRDIVADRIFAATVGLLAHKPAVVNQLKLAGVIAGLARLAADAIRTA
jgi:hypothetical protein